MSCVDVRLSLTSVDYCNLLISGGERGDQLWLPKDGWDLPSQDRTKRQVRIVTFILNCTEILLYPRFGHLGVAINLITYDDRFALHRWVFSAPNVRTLQLTSFQCYNFSVLTFFLYPGLNRSLGLRSDRYPGWVIRIIYLMTSKGYWSEFVCGFLLTISTRSILLTFHFKNGCSGRGCLDNFHYLWSSQDIDKALYVAEFHQEEDQEEC